MNRWTIRELLVRYKLEPSLRDVFVEGNSDKRLFQWFLKRSGLHDAKVLTINAVDVPPEMVARMGLTDGNKQRVITLAVELNSTMGNQALQFTCIVDADEDRLLERIISVPQLLWTDYVSLEGYLFDEEHITKFVHVVLERDSVDVQNMLAEYSRVLSELFLLRAAIRASAVPIRWLQFSECCSKGDSGIQLDISELVERLLNAAGARTIEAELKERIDELRPRMGADARDSMNGDDFIELLHWDFREAARGREWRNREAVGSALLCALEYGLISRLPLFEALTSRVSS